MAREARDGDDEAEHRRDDGLRDAGGEDDVLLDTIDRLTFEHENEELGNAVVGAMSFFHAAEAAFLDEEELE